MAAAGFLLVLGAFLLGSIPWGYLFGRWFAGIDLRTVGSGGTGATNALRTMGKPISAAVLLLDIAKGALPILVGRQLGIDGWWLAAAAVAAVAGHCWSPFIGFRGGKGVATGAGAAIALWPPVVLAILLLAAVVAVTRFVSLGSLVAYAAATIAAVGFAASGRIGWPVAIAVAGIAAIVAVQHRGNIQRLLAGTERRLGERLPLQASPPA